jgi:hypothetical protein
MRCAALHAPGDIRVEQRPDPVAGTGASLVRVTSVGLCGSDLHWFTAGAIGDAAISRPLVLGHEMAGIVVSGPLAGRGRPGTPASTRCSPATPPSMISSAVRPRCRAVSRASRATGVVGGAGGDHDDPTADGVRRVGRPGQQAAVGRACGVGQLREDRRGVCGGGPREQGACPALA